MHSVSVVVIPLTRSRPKTRFVRTGDVICRELHVQRCFRSARSGACSEHPSRAKHEDATHYNRWRGQPFGTAGHRHRADIGARGRTCTRQVREQNVQGRGRTPAGIASRHKSRCPMDPICASASWRDACRGDPQGLQTQALIEARCRGRGRRASSDCRRRWSRGNSRGEKAAGAGADALRSRWWPRLSRTAPGAGRSNRRGQLNARGKMPSQLDTLTPSIFVIVGSLAPVCCIICRFESCRPSQCPQ
jgi:hypothetical protein